MSLLLQSVIQRFLFLSILKPTVMAWVIKKSLMIPVLFALECMTAQSMCEYLNNQPLFGRRKKNCGKKITSSPRKTKSNSSRIGETAGTAYVSSYTLGSVTRSWHTVTLVWPLAGWSASVCGPSQEAVSLIALDAYVLCNNKQISRSRLVARKKRKIILRNFSEIL